MPSDLEPIGEHVDAELEAMKPAAAEWADLEFPQMIVDDLLEAGALTDAHLMRRIVGAAYALAVRTGSGTPSEVLDAALADVAFGETWDGNVAPRVRKLMHRAGLRVTGVDE